MLRLAHSQHVERWLGPELAEKISFGTQPYNFELPVLQTPWAVYKGEYYRKTVLTEIVSRAKRYLASEIGGFASLDDLRSDVKQFKKTGFSFAHKDAVLAGAQWWTNLYSRTVFPNPSMPSVLPADGGVFRDYQSANALTIRPHTVTSPNTIVQVLGIDAVTTRTESTFLVLIDTLWQASFITGLAGTVQVIPSGSRVMTRTGSASNKISLGIWAQAASALWGVNSTVTFLMSDDSTQDVTFSWNTAGAIVAQQTMVNKTSWVIGAPGFVKGLYSLYLGEIGSATGDLWISFDEHLAIVPVSYYGLVGGGTSIKGGFMLNVNADGNFTFLEQSQSTSAKTLTIRIYSAHG